MLSYSLSLANNVIYSNAPTKTFTKERTRHNMKISFIGGGKKLAAVCKIFENKSGFTLTGAYSNPLSACAETAIEYNMKIYRSMNALYEDSDVIVLAVNDRFIPGIISSLTLIHAHGRVFVTVSDRLTSSELSMAYPNACAIINSVIPIETIPADRICSASFVCELFGKNYNEFYNAILSSEINCKFISSKQLQMYRTSLHMATYATEAVLMSAIQLLKVSTVSQNPNHLMPVIKTALKNVFSDKTSTLYSPYNDGDLDEIRKHIEILDEVGIDSTKNLYNATALYLNERDCDDYEAADEVVRLIKNS